MTIDTEFEVNFHYSNVLDCIGCTLLVGEFSYTGFGSDWARATRQAMKCVLVNSATTASGQNGG